MNFFNTKKLCEKISLISKHKIISITIASLFIIALSISLYQAFFDWKRHIDYDEFINSAKTISQSENPYEKSDYYIYPLFISTILIPFSQLPRTVQFILWSGLSLFCFLFSLKILFDIFSRNFQIYLTNFQKIFFVSLSGIFLFIGLQTNLRLGQINLLILLLMLLSFKFHLKNKFILSAIFLSISIAIKLLPIFILLLLLIDKKFVSLILSLVFSLMLVFIIPLLVLEPGQIILFYKSYISNFFLSESLTFHNSIIFLPFLIQNISPDHIPFLLCYILGFLILTTPVFILYHKNKPHSTKTGLLSMLNLCLIIILLLSPRLQTHYIIYLLPVIFYLDLFILKNTKTNCLIYIILNLLILVGSYTFKLSKIPFYILLYSLYAFFLVIDNQEGKGSRE